MEEQNQSNAAGSEQTSEETTAVTPASPVGQANDGMEYTLESPEVLAYKERFTDVSDELAVSSIVTMHNLILSDERPAGENIDVIIDMITDRINNAKATAKQEASEAEVEKEETTGEDTKSEETAQSEEASDESETTQEETTEEAKSEEETDQANS